MMAAQRFATHGPDYDLRDLDRDEFFAAGHPGCERCGDPVCVAVTDGAHEDDCVCHGSICPGTRGKYSLFCGPTCRALDEDGAGTGGAR